MNTEHEDHARGARVEIAVRAATNGDIATAAGILAGMSRAERDEFGPLVMAAFPISRAGEPFGATSFLYDQEAVRG